jgi:hypothetical protein
VKSRDLLASALSTGEVPFGSLDPSHLATLIETGSETVHMPIPSTFLVVLLVVDID